jgi:thymidine phosphorylase
MAALITDMNRPLGATIGNAVEVFEAVEVLKGNGPADVRRLTIELTAHLAVLAGLFPKLAEARQASALNLDDGRALERFARMVAAQGGDPGFIHDAARLPSAPVQRDIPSPQGGFIADVDAETLGRVVLSLGAGRLLATDMIDHAVGISRLRSSGAPVTPGESLCCVHARTEADFQVAAQGVLQAITWSPTPPPPQPLILETLSEAR